MKETHPHSLEKKIIFLLSKSQQNLELILIIEGNIYKFYIRVVYVVKEVVLKRRVFFPVVQ